MTDDTMTDPTRELAAEYAQRRDQVKAPPGWRDDLKSPLHAVDQAMKVSLDVERQLADVRHKVERGVIHRDQGTVQRQHIIDAAKNQVTGFLETGRKVMHALPARITSKAWPDVVPKGLDWDTLAMEWESVSPDDAVQTFSMMVNDNIGRGDITAAQGLMSRRGRALLATTIGKSQTDEVWDDLRRDATEALGRVGDGANAEPGVALGQVDAVERAFTLGSNLADMLLEQNTAGRGV